MNPESCWYALLGGLAGGIAGALILWTRRCRTQDATSAWRRGLILLVGSGSIACAIFAYAKAFGADAPIQGALVTILVTAWLGVAGSVVRLPMPQRLLRALPGEQVLLKSRWTTVPAFGVLLRRTPLRHLGGRVYLASGGNNARLALEDMVAAEKLHLWALFGSLPWLVRWGMEGRRGALFAALLVHVPLNLLPVLHLRLAIWRTERCLQRLERGSNPTTRVFMTRPVANLPRIRE